MRLTLVTWVSKAVIPEATGRPSCHPSVLLKIYVYGYLNRIASSRRLERETQRHIEMMWLTGRLMPDFKTIANFRKENAKALRAVCREFVVLCRHLGLLADTLVAIDSSRFKAVNNRDRNFTVAKMKRRLKQIEGRIDRSMNGHQAIIPNPAVDRACCRSDGLRSIFRFEFTPWRGADWAV